MRDADLPLYFRLFNEIGILEQLSRARFEARLPDGVTVPHFSVLNHLMRVKDGRTPLEIATAFQVPKTTVSHWIAGLEKFGWVTLKPNPNDGRSKQVWITEAGKRFREEAIQALIPELREINEVLSEDEIRQMVEALARLRTWLDARR